MEEKKYIKISLSTFFLILAIIVIIVMAICIYKFYTEKMNDDKKISELQAQVNTNELDSNDTTNITYDVEVSMSELEKLSFYDANQLNAFENKYKGKIVKITGYVSSFGDSDVEPRKIFC